MPDLSWRSKRRLTSLREHGGKAALATVVEFDKRWDVPESGYGGMPLGHSEHYTLKIRVEPVGEPAFDAEIKEHDFFISNSGRPMMGDQFAVVYDPGDHSNVVRDPFDADSVIPPSRSEPAARPAEHAPPVRDTAAQLVDLADLHDRGVLSDAEFQAQKAKLLGDA